MRINSAYDDVTKFIENATSPVGFYDGIRTILNNVDEAHYPEDWHIKALQRLADAKYAVLSGK